jgi:phage regulator Rha-like protein
MMGWTGERAMVFMVRYIETFDAMEAQLNSGFGMAAENLSRAVDNNTRIPRWFSGQNILGLLI